MIEKLFHVCAKTRFVRCFEGIGVRHWHWIHDTRVNTKAGPRARQRLLSGTPCTTYFDLSAIHFTQDLRAVHNEGLAFGCHLKGERFVLILPSLLVESFFHPSLGMIRSCLRDMRRSFHEAFESLDYVFLVGGFSISPLVEAAVRRELDGCQLKTTLRPDVAIVRGAVIASSSSTVFDAPSPSKSRLQQLDYVLDFDDNIPDFDNNPDFDDLPDSVHRRNTSRRLSRPPPAILSTDRSGHKQESSARGTQARDYIDEV